MPPIFRGFRVAVPVCVSAAVAFLSLRCRLLDGSHYTRPTYVVQIKSTQTTPKPLQTLAFIGVSQPHDGDIKTADATATATTSRTPQPQHDTATAGAASRATRPRHRHDVRDATGTAMIAYKGTCPRDTTRHAKTQSYKRSNVAPCNKRPPVGEPPARPFCWGRWDNSRNSARVFEKFAHKT